MEEKYYKVLDADGCSPTTKFDYSAYLPKGGKAGKWLPEIADAEIRKHGYYASQYWFMWFAKGRKIYEVQLGEILKSDERGATHQVCSPKMRLLRDATEELLAEFAEHNAKIFNSNAPEKWNLGADNAGYGNFGNGNTGNLNIGNFNAGKRNRGSFNTGDCNCGMDNVGDNNEGSVNSGSRNIGHSNCGDGNRGSFNTGDNNRGHRNCGNGNIGNRNCGSFNTGDGNSGSYNIGNNHSGYFNTVNETPRFFNKPSSVQLSQIAIPKFLNYTNVKAAFENASDEDAKAALDLPNFDFKIFEKITGIAKSDFEKKLNIKL